MVHAGRDGQIILATAKHNLHFRGSTSAKARVLIGGAWWNVQSYAEDESCDVALLWCKTNMTKVRVMQLAAEAPKDGSKVICAGWKHGTQWSQKEATYSLYRGEDKRAYRNSADGPPVAAYLFNWRSIIGQSGGAVVSDGKLVGIIIFYDRRGWSGCVDHGNLLRFCKKYGVRAAEKPKPKKKEPAKKEPPAKEPPGKSEPPRKEPPAGGKAQGDTGQGDTPNINVSDKAKSGFRTLLRAGVSWATANAPALIAGGTTGGAGLAAAWALRWWWRRRKQRKGGQAQADKKTQTEVILEMLRSQGHGPPEEREGKKEQALPQVPQRNTTELHQLVQLGRLEGRDPLLDASFGMFIEDEIKSVLEGEGDGEELKAMLADILRRARERVDRAAPLHVTSGD